MATTLEELVEYGNATLEVGRFSDYCPNGLQVEGRPEVQRLACAVTANQAVLDAAVAWGADALLVHHGYFWRGEAPQLVGMKGRRVATLFAAQMSLLAYHLPLDAHPELGNNAQLAARLGIEVRGPLGDPASGGVGNCGEFRQPQTLARVAEQLEQLTGRTPLLIGDPAREVRSVAWCTGAAQGYIDRAAAAGAALYISGEISEQTVHEARELGIAYIAAGHHATERYGVQALARHLANRFALDTEFIDCDNPV
jgi:dinuclear metal center YbgI/SA1388 family protein